MSRILPSLLSADFVNLERDIRLMEQAGAEVLHLDVMDGHFVPNLTFGPPVIRAIREITKLTLDVHLMISNAEESFQSYVEAGADWLSVHLEAVTHLDRLLDAIRQAGAQPGVALNPHSPPLLVEEVLARCHHVLVMSVNPGFGGQKFISSSLQKVRKLREMILARSLSIHIEIDGGIDLDNVGEASRAGADLLVSGSSIFGSGEPSRTFREMASRLEDPIGVN